MGKTNRDWYKHHPKAPLQKERIGGDNFWRYQEEDDPDGTLEHAKALEDRAQVTASAARHADQLFDQMSRANRLASDTERQFSAAAASTSAGVTEMDVGKLEQIVSVLPVEIRLNLNGALDRPMCPPSYWAAGSNVVGDDDAADEILEDFLVAGGIARGFEGPTHDFQSGTTRAQTESVVENDTSGDHEIDALLDI